MPQCSAEWPFCVRVGTRRREPCPARAVHFTTRRRPPDPCRACGVPGFRLWLVVVSSRGVDGADPGNSQCHSVANAAHANARCTCSTAVVLCCGVRSVYKTKEKAAVLLGCVPRNAEPPVGALVSSWRLPLHSVAPGGVCIDASRVLPQCRHLIVESRVLQPPLQRHARTPSAANLGTQEASDALEEGFGQAG